MHVNVTTKTISLSLAAWCAARHITKITVPKFSPKSRVNATSNRWDRFGVAKRVGIETAKSRQSGANHNLFHADLAIPYQHWIDIGFVPIFPNAWVYERGLA
jgi:hypothetical protein